ncbi:MAG: hypothetical protein GJV46_07175 [Geobacter sp.]|nr:hypothetical protein [Geobacter sp.]
MLKQNRINLIGLFAMVAVFGTSSLALAATTCPSPNPAATNWACVDMYLTPSPKLVGLDLVAFKVNNTQGAVYASDSSINEASVLARQLEPFSLVPPALTNSVFLWYGTINGPHFTPTANPSFRISYYFTSGLYPVFTNDLSLFAVDVYNDPMNTIPTSANDVTLKTQYVLNNGATIIDNGFPLDLAITGSGTGTVTSSPAGISCSGGTCRYPFSISNPVTLTATPTNGSCFSAFTYTGVTTSSTVSVGSTNSNPYNISSYDPTSTSSVTAQFLPSNAAITSPSPTEYCTLQEAVNAASTGSSVMVRSGVLSNTLVMNRSNTTLTLKGGYTDFASTSSGFTSLSGPLTIQQGTLVVDSIAVL